MSQIARSVRFNEGRQLKSSSVLVCSGAGFDMVIVMVVRHCPVLHLAMTVFFCDQHALLFHSI